MHASRFSWLLVSVVSLGLGCGPGANPGADAGDGGATDARVQRDAIDPGWFVDDDGDGYSEAQGDCDDTDPLVVPFGVEICGDGIDNNCNHAIDGQEPDGDSDGFGPCNGDCNDHDPTINPAAQEIPGDGIDNNCDGIVDADLDGDGWTAAEGDCNDQDDTIYPGAREHCFDGKDNNCDGAIDGQAPDADGDGYGPCAGDCDDTDPFVHPGAPEVVDGIDNNCDNLVDEDLDGDGWTALNGDCDDTDPARNPAAYEICDDGIDNNCNGIVDADCLSPCEMAALLRSSVGCVYYAVDTNPIHSFVAGDYAVSVSNIDPVTPANVVIEVKNGGVWSTVANGSFQVQPLSLRSTVLPHRYTSGSTIYAGGAYRITSDLPVIAYQFNPLDGSSSYLSDASLLLPVSSYDRFYIVPAWPYGPADGSSSSGHPAHIQIAASEPTTVTVTSTATTQAGGVAALSPGVPASFTLDTGDYLQLTIQNFMDSFNGTYVEATRPVAVFTSNDCANVPASGSTCCCEHLEEQVFGLQTWGTTYVASRVKQRSAEPAVWHILAYQDNTSITFNADGQVTGLPGPTVINARQWIELSVNGPANQPGDFLVHADKPILVTQYMVASALVDGSTGDPSMVQAVPVEQFLDRYVVLVPGTWVYDTLTLTRPAGHTVTVDGAPVNAGWVTVGTSGYEVARVSVADGVHVLEGSAPFGVIVMGYDQFDSYAYPGGLDQKLINPIN
jgi:hypothetical protein